MECSLKDNTEMHKGIAEVHRENVKLGHSGTQQTPNNTDFHGEFVFCYT